MNEDGSINDDGVEDPKRVDVSRAGESEKAARIAVWVLVALGAIVLFGVVFGRA